MIEIHNIWTIFFCFLSCPFEKSVPQIQLELDPKSFTQICLFYILTSGYRYRSLHVSENIFTQVKFCKTCREKNVYSNWSFESHDKTQLQTQNWI